MYHFYLKQKNILKCIFTFRLFDVLYCSSYRLIRRLAVILNKSTSILYVYVSPFSPLSVALHCLQFRHSYVYIEALTTLYLIGSIWLVYVTGVAETDTISQAYSLTNICLGSVVPFSILISLNVRIVIAVRTRRKVL